MGLLENYQKKKDELKEQIQKNTLKPDDLTIVQELFYRIGVLETFKTFCNTVPITKDLKVLSYHYQLVKAYIHCIETERKFGPKVDAEGLRKREAGATTLSRIISDGIKRFETFKVTDEKTYSKTMIAFINSLLSVWIQYRDTYVKL